jgi:hypothetical protein
MLAHVGIVVDDEYESAVRCTLLFGRGVDKPVAEFCQKDHGGLASRAGPPRGHGRAIGCMNRQADDESRPAEGTVLNMHVTAMERDEFLDDREAQSSPAGLARIFELLETLEDLRP